MIMSTISWGSLSQGDGFAVGASSGGSLLTGGFEELVVGDSSKVLPESIPMTLVRVSYQIHWMSGFITTVIIINRGVKW